MKMSEAERLAISKPCALDDLPECVYHTDPCVEPSLSSTMAKTLLSGKAGPARLKQFMDEGFGHKAVSDLGSAAREQILNRGIKLEFLDADSWRSKAAREWRDEVYERGGVPMVIFPNRRRASRAGRRSEITKPVRALTDQAVRTLIGMDVNREFFSAPQRYIIGADEKQFSGKTGWELLVGSYLAIGANEDGEMPKVDQFPAASSAPYVDQLQALSQLLAAEAAVPRNYLGFVTVNPSSADAIRAEEARLVKRLAETASTDKAWDGLINRLAVDSDRAAKTAGRQTVIRSTEASGRAWRRISDGNPCSFCAMLVSRGPVYTSSQAAGEVVGVRGVARGKRKTGELFHDHCGCTVVELYGSWAD